MSSRSYFEHRDTVPGLLFLIVIVLSLLPEIHSQTSFLDLTNFDLTTGIIISFLTFFGSTTITYIINQFWFNLLDNIFMRIFFGKLEERDIYKFLIDLHIKKDKGPLIAVSNYLASTHGKELSEYIDRKWDLYNLLGSMATSCFLGILISFLLKLYIHNEKIGNINYYIKFLILLIAFICLLITGMFKNRRDGMQMNILCIRRRLRINPLDQIIPREYFHKTNQIKK